MSAWIAAHSSLDFSSESLVIVNHEMLLPSCVAGMRVKVEVFPRIKHGKSSFLIRPLKNTPAVALKALKSGVAFCTTFIAVTYLNYKGGRSMQQRDSYFISDPPIMVDRSLYGVSQSRGMFVIDTFCRAAWPIHPALFMSAKI